MVQTQLGHHPIAIHFAYDGTIAFTPIGHFKSISDISNGLQVYITPINLTIIDIDSKDEMLYNLRSWIDYKKEPLLLQWLKSFNL